MALFGSGALGNALNAVSENPVMDQQPMEIRNTADDRIIANREALSRGGVTVRIPGVKFKFQNYPIHISSPNTRYDFSFLTDTQHERVIGFFITSNQFVANELNSNVNYGKMELTIDGEEIIPAETSASLFVAKHALGFYDNMYVLNEKALSSKVKGCYTSGPTGTTWPEGGYDIVISLYCIKK